MCASPLRGAAGPVRPGRILICLCRRSASDFFFRFFRSYPFVIRAEVALANASTGICLLRLRMERRMKSAVTVSNAAVKELGAQSCVARMRVYSLLPVGERPTCEQVG